MDCEIYNTLYIVVGGDSFVLINHKKEKIHYGDLSELEKTIVDFESLGYCVIKDSNDAYHERSDYKKEN